MYHRIEEIEASQSLAALELVFESVLKDLGFDFFIYLTCDQDRREPFLLSNMNGLHDGPIGLFDPFLDYCCASYDVTFTGVEYLSDYPYLSDRDRAFIQQAADTAGFRSGIGIPVRLAGSDRFGGFNLGTRHTRTDFEAHVFPQMDKLRVLALLAHRRIEELWLDADPSEAAEPFRKRTLADPDARIKSLSPREKEVLFLVAQGYSTKEIARLCRIMPNTAAEYRKAAYKKLNVSNATAAVAKAFDLGLVPISKQARSETRP